MKKIYLLFTIAMIAGCTAGSESQISQNARCQDCGDEDDGGDWITEEHQQYVIDYGHAECSDIQTTNSLGCSAVEGDDRNKHQSCWVSFGVSGGLTLMVECVWSKNCEGLPDRPCTTSLTCTKTYF